MKRMSAIVIETTTWKISAFDLVFGALGVESEVSQMELINGAREVPVGCLPDLKCFNGPFSELTLTFFGHKDGGYGDV